MKNGQVALSIASAYFLGRSHKTRWALALAGMAAGSRLRPGGEVGTKLLKSPEINKLTQTLRDELLSAGKTAAVAAAGSRIDSLSDRMQRRASSLRAGLEAEEPRDEEEEKEEPGEEEEKEEPAEEAKQREWGRSARTRAPSGNGRTRTPATRPAADKKKTSGSNSKSTSRKTASSRRTASSGSSGSGGSAQRGRG
ncbi:hypothetical protein [Streptomyces pseudoechinosporeus]